MMISLRKTQNKIFLQKTKLLFEVVSMPYAGVTCKNLEKSHYSVTRKTYQNDVTQFLALM